MDVSEILDLGGTQVAVDLSSSDFNVLEISHSANVITMPQESRGVKVFLDDGNTLVVAQLPDGRRIHFNELSLQEGDVQLADADAAQMVCERLRENRDLASLAEIPFNMVKGDWSSAGIYRQNNDASISGDTEQQSKWVYFLPTDAIGFRTSDRGQDAYCFISNEKYWGIYQAPRLDGFKGTPPWFVISLEPLRMAFDKLDKQLERD